MFFKNYIKDCLCVDKHHDGLWHGEEDRFVYSIHPFPLTHLKITCVLYLKKSVFIYDLNIERLFRIFCYHYSVYWHVNKNHVK